MRKALRFIPLVAGLLLLLPQTLVLANHDTYFSFLGVVGATCTPGDSNGYRFEYGVAEGDTSSHIWTLENPRTGTSTGPSMVILMDSEEHFEIVENGGVNVPAGTEPGDTLIVTVTATSEIGDDDTDSLAYDCSTGEVVDGNDDDDGEEAGEPFNPGDARLNHEDAGASYAVYCNEDNSVTVVAIPKNGTPFVSFVATLAEIDAAGTNPSPAAAIDSGLSGSGGTITLYRRPDGFFQVSGPSHDPTKGYFVDFDACPATTVNTWEA